MYKTMLQRQDVNSVFITKKKQGKIMTLLGAPTKT